jgi:hypothetical protein
MDFIVLAKKALEKIKEQYGLPTHGFLAGGALANTMWSLYTGKPGPINDIDIFYMDSIISDTNINKSEALFGYKEQERKYFEDYTGITWSDYVKDLYIINSAENDGIFNKIGYSSSTDNPEIILKAFDLNCVKVGYDIEKDIFYISEEFKDFLKTGKIKIVSLTTPAHTALRIIKKSKELNVEFDEMEIKLTTHALLFGFVDSYKRRFKEKYSKMYEENKDVLGKYFDLKRDYETEEFVRINYNKETILYELVPKDILKSKKIFEKLEATSVFHDNNLDNIHTSREFLFYMRNVYKTEKAKYWSKLYFYFKESNYLDDRISIKDVDLLHRVAIYAPNAIQNLSGMSATEQVSKVRELLDTFKEDPEVAISILEKGSFKNVDISDEINRLILELSVRKINDTKGKAQKILDDTELI